MSHACTHLSQIPSHLSAINWYPGHMHKGFKDLSKIMAKVNILVECRDARVPISVINKNFDSLCANHPNLTRFIVLNKCDLADPTATRSFTNHLALTHHISKKRIFHTSLHTPRSFLPLLRMAKNIALQQDPVRPLTIALAGTPNVGKSSIINTLRNLGSSRKKAATTGGQPGVTKHVSTTPMLLMETPKIYLLDSPGILDNKPSTPELSFRLALTGGIRDHIAGPINLADYLIFALRGRLMHHALATLFHIPIEAVDPYADGWSLGRILDHVALRIGALDPGAVPDRVRAANFMIHAFRNGKLGRISLDYIQTQDPDVLTSTDDLDGSDCKNVIN